MKKRDLMTKRSYFFILLITIACIPALWGMFHTGMFVTDDGNWMIIRLSAFYETLKTGQFPVRFIARLNNGYGYPLTDFMYPGFLYLGVLIHLLGFGFINTIKIIMGLSLVLSGIFVYLWLEKIFPKKIAFFSSIFSIYLPYHILDIYKRGSVGEVFALAIAPFIFWQIQQKRWVLVILGIAVLVIAHNTVAFLFMPVLWGYVLLTIHQTKFYKKLLYSLVPFVVAAAVSAFFWFPAVYDLQYTQFSSTTISDWRLYFANIPMIGMTVGIVLLGSIVVAYLRKKLKNPLFLFFLGITSLCLLLSLPISTPLWQIIPSSLIQFPFRLLSVIIITGSFLFASLLFFIPQKWQMGVGIFLCLIVFFDAKSYLYPLIYSDQPDAYYLSNFSTTTVKNEYMPKWVKEVLPGSMEKAVVTSGKGSIQNVSANASKIAFTTNLKTKSTIRINTIYFPGWRVYVNGIEKPVLYNNSQGLMQVVLAPGNHTVLAKFTETVPRAIADGVSLLAVATLLVYYFKKERFYGRQDS